MTSIFYLCNLSAEETIAKNAGFVSFEQYKFGTSRGLNQNQVTILKKYGVDNADNYDAGLLEIKNTKYSDNQDTETFINFLKDKTEAAKNGLSISDQRKKRLDNAKYEGCYLLDEKYALWATGNKTLNSCDPNVISSKITEKYAQIQLWKFKNNHEILRYTASSKPYLAETGYVDSSQISEYTRKGNILQEKNPNGCNSKEEIIEENSNFIRLKSLEFGGSSCAPARIRIGKDSIGRETKYIKINDTE